MAHYHILLKSKYIHVCQYTDSVVPVIPTYILLCVCAIDVSSETNKVLDM